MHHHPLSQQWFSFPSSSLSEPQDFRTVSYLVHSGAVLLHGREVLVLAESQACVGYRFHVDVGCGAGGELAVIHSHLGRVETRALVTRGKVVWFCVS